MTKPKPPVLEDIIYDLESEAKALFELEDKFASVANDHYRSKKEEPGKTEKSDTQTDTLSEDSTTTEVRTTVLNNETHQPPNSKNSNAPNPVEADHKVNSDAYKQLENRVDELTEQLVDELIPRLEEKLKERLKEKLPSIIRELKKETSNVTPPNNSSE